MSALREVLHLPLLTRPPGSPAFLEGFFQLGDEQVAVVRLDSLLGLDEARPELYTPLLLLRGRALALMVERTADLVDLDEMECRPLEADQHLNDLVRATFGEGVLLLDPEGLLLREEHERVESLRARRRARIEQLGELS